MRSCPIGTNLPPGRLSAGQFNKFSLGVFMLDIRKPKIGLAGVMCTPFRGDKEGNYKNDLAGLEKLSDQLDFDFYPILDGIYAADQAESAAKELQDWGADFVLLQTSSFAAGDFVYPFVHLPTKLGIWAVPEGPPTLEGGLPLNSFTAANLYNSIIKTQLKDYKSPVKWFMGRPDDPLFNERLQVTVGALRALINMKGNRVALIGGVAPTFDNLIIDDQKLKHQLDIDVVYIEFDELINIAKALDEHATTQVAEEIKGSAREFDKTQIPALMKTAQVHRAVEILAMEKDLQAVALSCWPRFQSDYQLAVCTAMGHLNTKGVIAACEGDIPSAVSMLTLHYLTNGDVATIMDLVSVDDRDESVLLWHCGPTSPALADEQGVIMEPLWLFDGPGDDHTGLHNDLVLKQGVGTVLGFTVDFERMLILGGEIENTKPSYKGCRGWFKNLSLNLDKITTKDLVQTIMISGYQHHYPFAYGDLNAAALELCQWLGIEPIQIENYTTYVR
jgi:hypothetical protein